jgi:hypothetical protein
VAWTGWIALIGSQITVICVAAFILFKDAIHALELREKLVCFELLGFALSVFLLNEAIYQAITPRIFPDARAIVLSRIRRCLYRIALIALLESWLFGAW